MNDPAELKYVVRSISLPVQECLSVPWPEFLYLLHDCWRHSTSLANWAAHTLRAHDVVRTPGMTQLPPLVPMDLYALAFGRAKVGKPRTQGKAPLPIVAAQYDGGDFWAGAKIAAATLLRKVDRKYRQERGKIVWRRERRTPEFSYPYPFLVHQDAWLVTFNDHKQPLLFVQLPGGRVQVRLRNGPEFAPAIRVLQDVADGKLKQMELIICRQRSGSNHRANDQQRSSGGQSRNSYRIMVRIAYRREVIAATGDKAATVRTGRDPFLTLTVPGEDRLWVLHCPWVQRWTIEHRRFLDQFADDTKFEKRWPAQKRRSLSRYRDRRVDRHANRMKSWRQMTAAQVVGHAQRRGCGRLVWDDSDRTFAEELPWHLLAQAVRCKCEELDILFEKAASTTMVEEGGESESE